jgi:uncharacterized protein (TIGR02217 family)
VSVSTIVLSDFVAADYGQQYPVKMRKQWRTDVVPMGQREQRNEEWPQPKRWFFVNWQALSDESNDRLTEMHDRARGRANTFLWRARKDFLCENEQIATDGSAATYQLVKTYYPSEAEEWTEDKKDIVPGGTYPPVVTHDVDGAQTEVAAAPGANEFTLNDATGIMTWSGGNEPSAGVLTVTFQFYFRVRWTSDEHTECLFMPNYYRLEGPGPHLVEVIS